MNKNNIDYEKETLRLKSLCTLLAGFDPDNTAAIYELVEVAKMAVEKAETIYTAFADGEVIKA